MFDCYISSLTDGRSISDLYAGFPSGPLRSVRMAAVVQLSVPVIAALGGILFMSETITLRLTLSAVLVLGGIFLVVYGRY